MGEELLVKTDIEEKLKRIQEVVNAAKKASVKV